jgi:organic radical activating enzyme|tara:strand:- start:1706 stop:2809 length:1104 start_codon:yes stop_codon:yes gene_type:complete
MTKCAVPFIEGFTSDTGTFRNCCATYPHIESKPGQKFKEWWHSKELNDFRDSLKKDKLPKACQRCEIAEKVQGSSFRTAINKTVDLDKIDSKWPSRWNIIFGNICNLACWSCNETSSSTIQMHKKKLGLLPYKFKDPELVFEKNWKTLKKDILESYNYHDTVSLTILGGEPLYNKKVLAFLGELIRSKLAHRTRLEFHTNATQAGEKIRELLNTQTWKYICIFLSIDAVGKKAEWLRYGSKWDKLEQNIPHLAKLSNYIEIHCTLGVLNICDLPGLHEYCKKNSIKLKIHLLSNPWYMSLENWDGDPDQLVNEDVLTKHGFKEYYQLIGKTHRAGSSQALKKYIESFNTIRKPLKEFDPVLAEVLKV